MNEKSKPTYENIISGLPQEIKEEIIKMNDFLKSLKPLKFKRMVDKHGTKITYVASEYGISYAIKISDSTIKQNFWWYIVHSGKPETWHRRADYMEETFVEIAKTDPKLSERIFNALKVCGNCYGDRCLAKTQYEYNGEKKIFCHGRAEFQITRDECNDIQSFFRYVNELMKRKADSGEPLPEKIYLMK